MSTSIAGFAALKRIVDESEARMRHVERCEEPGPPPRRHLTPKGRWFLLYVAVGVALLALALFMCGGPSRFGPVGW